MVENKRQSVGKKDVVRRFLQSTNKMNLSRIMVAILFASLIITILVGYSSAISRDNEDLANKLRNAKADRYQAVEHLVAVRYDELASSFSGATSQDVKDDNFLRIKILNDGPAPASFRFVLLYCISHGCQ